MAQGDTSPQSVQRPVPAGRSAVSGRRAASSASRIRTETRISQNAALPEASASRTPSLTMQRKGTCQLSRPPRRWMKASAPIREPAPSAGLPCQFANMRSSRHEGDQSLPVVEERSGGTTCKPPTLRPPLELLAGRRAVPGHLVQDHVDQGDRPARFEQPIERVGVDHRRTAWWTHCRGQRRRGWHHFPLRPACRAVARLNARAEVHAPGPQSRQRSTGGGPMRRARCSPRSAVRRPSSMTGW